MTIVRCEQQYGGGERVAKFSLHFSDQDLQPRHPLEEAGLLGALRIVDGGAVAYLAPLILNPDGKLKRQVCSCLAQISKHSVDLAEVVVEAEIFPGVLNLLKDLDVYVRKNAATCIREVAKHTPELAQLIVNAGGVGAMVDYVTEARGNARLPGIMTLGYISAFSETLALAGMAFTAAPRTHGLIRRRPRTLGDLHRYLAEAGEDLLAAIRQRLRSWHRDGTARNYRFSCLYYARYLCLTRIS